MVLTSDLPATPASGEGGVASPQAPRSRRLSDKILVAFHQACDQQDLEIAAALLRTLEAMVVRSGPNPNRRKDADTFVAAHERLWSLRHPEAREQ